MPQIATLFQSPVENSGPSGSLTPAATFNPRVSQIETAICEALSYKASGGSV
jgi:hypothetical protein